jgi:TolA-binding protein
MKRYLISSIVVLTVLAMTWIAFGQPQGDFRERMARMREAQSKALEVLQQQVAVLKKGIEQPSAFDPNRFREMSDEEREKFREERMKSFEARRTAINSIIAQVAILQGQPQPAEGERYILVNTADLKAAAELATKEKATETAERIKELLEPPRRGFGGRRGQPGERPRPQQEGAGG